jgi:hypothetical protein
VRKKLHVGLFSIILLPVGSFLARCGAFPATSTPHMAPATSEASTPIEYRNRE